MKHIPKAARGRQSFLYGLLRPQGLSLLPILVVCACFLSAGNKTHADGSGSTDAPTHADAALIFAKHVGLFNRYVPPDADLNDCLTFLNKQGVFFDLMKVVNGTRFTEKDCARVMGQIALRLSGEDERSLGKVRLPKYIDSWGEFCVLNEIDFKTGYKKLCVVGVAIKK